MEHLFLELKSANISDAGELSGYGNVTGNLDRAGEIVMPGAYKNLDEFVRSGFGAVGHDWKQPVAMIAEAREDANGLYVRMPFHTTQEAQDCRKIVQERLAAGKTVGLSIGYRVLEDEWKTTEGRQVRYLKSLEVYEVSVVTVPANPAALVLSAKGGKVDMPLEDHTLCMVDALEQWVGRLKARSDDRVKAGRTLSGSTRECMSRACEAMMEAHARLSELMESTDKPKEIDQELAALQIAALTRQAARRGMAL